MEIIDEFGISIHIDKRLFAKARSSSKLVHGSSSFAYETGFIYGYAEALKDSAIWIENEMTNIVGEEDANKYAMSYLKAMRNDGIG